MKKIIFVLLIVLCILMGYQVIYVGWGLKEIFICVGLPFIGGWFLGYLFL